MPLKLTPELRKALPEPDSGGVIRATAALKIDGDKLRVLEINDTPVSYAEDDDEKTDDDAPMPESDVPDLYEAERQINAP